MISEIRVKSRAASMEQAEREIGMLLAHAQQAGFLEGITPQISNKVDDHYGNVYGNDGWNDLGQSYEGRVTIRFEPEVVEGGLKEYGYKVAVDMPDVETSPLGSHGDDCTERVMVLTRENPVTRLHSWEGTSSYGYKSGEHESGLATFNRPRHEMHGNYEVSVWLRGVTEGGADQPRELYGTVVDKSPDAPENAEPMFEYVHELKIGEDIDRMVEDVFEKCGIYADGLNRVTKGPGHANGPSN